MSLPLRRGGEPIGVVTLENPVDRPLRLDEIETLRLTVDLTAARLGDLHKSDKWIGAKVTDATRKGLSGLLGPTHASQ